MINLLLIINRQGNVRIMKWYDSFKISERQKCIRELAVLVVGRTNNHTNFIEWGQHKIIYKRYSSLFFITLCDMEDNELIILEILRLYVEMLDRYFGMVCDLDIVFNYQKCYYILEEILSAGYIQEADKKEIMKSIKSQDQRIEEEEEEKYK